MRFRLAGRPSASEVAFGSTMVCSQAEGRSSIIPDFIGLPKEAGSLWALPLAKWLAPWLGLYQKHRFFFPCTERQGDSPRGQCRKRPYPAHGCSFFKAVHSPRFPSIHEPPGSCFGGGFPYPRQGALIHRILRMALAMRFHDGSPVPRST